LSSEYKIKLSEVNTLFEKLVSFTKKVADLADSPSLNPTELKAQFDAAPDEVRQYLNKLVDALVKTTAGDSGAKNIGATSISGLTGNDVQSLLDSLNTKINDQSIIETGSNGNGSYVKYGNGTMECWKTEEYKPTATAAWSMTPLAGNTYYYIAGTWTYPVPFKTDSKVACFMSGDLDGSQLESHNAYHKTHTQCAVESGAFGNDVRGKNLVRQLYARGYWK
jgi:hypothetical protein